MIGVVEKKKTSRKLFVDMSHRRQLFIRKRELIVIYMLFLPTLNHPCEVKSNLSDLGLGSGSNREVLLLLGSIAASRSVHLLLAVCVGPDARSGVSDLVLQLQEVLALGGVDVCVVGLVGGGALALDVVLVIEATRALVLLRVILEVEVEGVEAAGGAAEDEFVNIEVAEGLDVAVAVVTAVVVVVRAAGGSGGDEAGGTDGEDSRGAHLGCLFELAVDWLIWEGLLEVRVES
jgi:hypothetical protein